MPRRPPLGQHFLHDPSILARLAEALHPTPRDTVLEIGAGPGALTAQLATRVGRLVAIERDPTLGEALRERVARPEWKGITPTVIIADALDVDWHAAVGHRSFKAAGNIPYRITSPLIERALRPPRPELIVFLVQREVADRLTAPPGSRSYGALTVGVGAVATVEQLFVVKAGAFLPPPGVDSAAVRIVPRSRPLVAPGEGPSLRRLVTGLFAQRRKQLGTALRRQWGLAGAEVARVLEEVRIDPTVRAETLEVEEFVRLLRAGGDL